MHGLEIATMDEFLQECRLRGITEIGAAAIYHTAMGTHNIPITSFIVKLTAIDKKQDIVLCYQDKVGSDTTYFTDKIMELQEKAANMIRAMTDDIEKDSVFRVIRGEFK